MGDAPFVLLSKKYGILPENQTVIFHRSLWKTNGETVSLRNIPHHTLWGSASSPLWPV